MTWADDKLVGLDLETTGRDPLTCRPVAVALCYFDAGKCAKTRFAYIDPEIPIPEEATEIHGITDAMVKERGGNLQRSLDGICAELLDASEKGIPVVGMNLVFDLTIIDRGAATGLRSMGWHGPVIDVSVIDRHVDPYRRGKRKLSDLCKHYHVDPGQSHHASADAFASVLIARVLAKRHSEIRDADTETLHYLQQAWRREWLVGFNEYRVKSGQEALPDSEGDWPIMGETAKPYKLDPAYTAEQKSIMEAANEPF